MIPSDSHTQSVSETERVWQQMEFLHQWQNKCFIKENVCSWHIKTIFEFELDFAKRFHHTLSLQCAMCMSAWHCGDKSKLLTDNILYVITRALNLLISFLSESLVFCPKMSKWAIRSKKQAIHYFAHFYWVTWAICSWSLIFGERPVEIAHGCSFVMSDLSDLLTLLIFLVSDLSNLLTSLTKKLE